MSTDKKLQMGRPWPEDMERAESQIQLRVKRTRKAAWTKAAQANPDPKRRTLAAFITDLADAASGYKDPDANPS